MQIMMVASSYVNAHVTSDFVKIIQMLEGSQLE